MKARAVRAIESPAYPRREDVLREPDVLERHVPRGWRRLGGVAAMLLASSLPGCGDLASDVTTADEMKPPEPIVELASWWTDSLMRESRPILGCVIIMPPAFYSEEETAPLPRLPLPPVAE